MTTKALGRVSILVFTHNNITSIAECLNSIVSQSSESICEILVCDNASTDGTVEYLQSKVLQSPIPLKLIINSENLFLQGSKFALDAMEECVGEYIAVIDGDDAWILPNKIELQVALMREKPDISIVATRAEYFDVSKNTVLNVGPGDIYVGQQDSTKLASENFLCNSSVLFRSSILSKIPSDYFYIPIKDYPIWVWGSTQSFIEVLPEITTRYNLNTGSNVSTKKIKLERFYDVIFTKVAIARKLEDHTVKRIWLSEIQNDIEYFLEHVPIKDSLEN